MEDTDLTVHAGSDDPIAAEHLARRQARLAQILGSEYQGEDPFVPLVIGDEDWSDVVPGHRLGFYFKLATPEKLDKLMNAKASVSAEKTETGTAMRMLPTLWGVARCLIADDLVTEVVLPRVQADGTIEAVHIRPSEISKPKAIAELASLIKKLPLLAAIETAAMEFYTGGVEVESDLGN